MGKEDKPLHLALLSYRGNMFCGGQGVYLTNLARALLRRGHRVHIFAGPPWPEDPPGATVERLFDENFINRDARHLPAEPLRVFAPLSLAEYGLARAGSNPEMLAFSLRAFARLRAVHARDPFDLVHDNQGLGYGLLLMRALGLPVAATIHHPLQVDRAEDIRQLDGLGKKMKRAIYYPVLMQRLVARRLDQVISVSAFSAELVARTYGLERGRMEVVPNGVDSDLFAPLEGVEREDGRLLFVGSTEDRKKGIVYLLEALALLPPPFRLVIVDGRRYPGRVYAAELVSRLGLGGRVVFRDGIDNAELVREYNRAETMAMPSLFEGFGLPALEAMATATPLVVSAAGALPEVVDAESAVLVRPRSARELARALLELHRSPERRRALGAAGRRRAVERFSWDRAAREMERIYRELLAR
jgi:glycosyltransferase involved in cell wall biosynthesis